MMGKCEECKHLNKELAFCRACGAKWLNDKDGENCKYFEQKQPPTVFQQITASPEVLAPYLVFFSTRDNGWCSMLTMGSYDTYKEAIAATVAKLKGGAR